MKLMGDLVEKILKTDERSNPLQGAQSDVYLGTNERTLGGFRREYGFGKLRNGISFGQKFHPTFGIGGTVAQFDVVKASGHVPNLNALQMHIVDMPKDTLMMADSYAIAKDLLGRIVTAARSGKRFYVESICYDMSAESSFSKEGYLWSSGV